MSTTIQFSSNASGLFVLIALAIAGCAAGPSTSQYLTAAFDSSRPPQSVADLIAARPATDVMPPVVEQSASRPSTASDLHLVSYSAHVDRPEVYEAITDQTKDVVEAGTPKTLDEFQQLALANNPTIAQASANIDKAAGIRDQVGRRPNPTIGYFGSQIADAGTDQHGLFLEQEIVRGNKLALNRAVMSRAMQAQSAELEAQRFRVQTDIRLKFFAALAAQRQIELTNDFLLVSKKGVEIADQRKQALEGSQADLLQAKIQLQEIELAHQRAEFAFVGSFRELAATAGAPNIQPTPLAGDLRLPIQAMDWDQAYGNMLASSPELQAAQARVEQACANLDRQQVQSVPNPTIHLGTGIDNGTGSGFLNVQVSAPIPVHNGNEGNICAARAEYNRATNEVVRIELSIKARLAKVSQEFDSALASVQRYETEILPKTQETLQLAEKAYAAGEFDFLQVFIVRRNYFESGLTYVRALADLAQAQAKIDGLLLEGGLDARDGFDEDDGIREKTFSQQ